MTLRQVLKTNLSTVLVTALKTASRRSSRRLGKDMVLKTAGPRDATVLVKTFKAVSKRPRDCHRDGPPDGLETVVETAL
jgi:hypothetical protein